MKKGFTLVELLVVIAIIAVLGTAVVLVLNPAELVKQGRDSTRVSDLGNLNSAVALYLSQVETPGIGGTNHSVCSSLVRCTGYQAAYSATTTPFTSTSHRCTSSVPYVTSTSVDGSGWVTIKLDGVTGGSPLSRLPLDPLYNANNSGNSSIYYYAYACSGLNYELAGKLESTKYASTSVNDGGNNDNWFELGNALSTF